jgi:hypothetical protein
MTGAGPKIAGDMSRLIVLCQRPLRVSHPEATEWIEHEVQPLARLDYVARVDLTELRRTQLRWSGAHDWLIEVQLHDETHAEQLLDESFFTGLLADLRLLGMRPTVAVGDPATPLIDKS